VGQFEKECSLAAVFPSMLVQGFAAVLRVGMSLVNRYA
jgi:hypothetical protein